MISLQNAWYLNISSFSHPFSPPFSFNPIVSPSSSLSPNISIYKTLINITFFPPPLLVPHLKWPTLPPHLLSAFLFSSSYTLHIFSFCLSILQPDPPKIPQYILSNFLPPSFSFSFLPLFLHSPLPFSFFLSYNHIILNPLSLSPFFFLFIFSFVFPFQYFFLHLYLLPFIPHCFLFFHLPPFFLPVFQWHPLQYLITIHSLPPLLLQQNITLPSSYPSKLPTVLFLSLAIGLV